MITEPDATIAYRRREKLARVIHALLSADFGTCDHSRETMKMWQCRRWSDALGKAEQRP